MAIPYGPRPVAANGQVVLPKDLLTAVGLKPGESTVFVLANDELAGTILVVPDKLMEEWVRVGRKAVGRARRRSAGEKHD